MKLMSLIVLTTITLSDVYGEEEKKFPVLVRKETSNRTYILLKTLPNLTSPDSFEGKHFKIVLGKSNTPIRFDDSQDLTLKASTAYYHLNESRKFWVEAMKSEVAENLPKITVRLDISNQFDELGHFANDNRAPQFNNALSIPEGETPSWVPEDRRDKWSKEIWFRPMKKIPTKELGDLGPNPMTLALKRLENPLMNYLQGQFNVRLMEHIFYANYVSRPLHEDAIRYAGTLALMKVMIQGSKYTDKLFLEKYYYLDAALVPEIAYHEYAHLVLSDKLELSHSTPVVEGMADYFAAVQAKKRKIYAKVRGFSNAAHKDTQEKRKYSHWDESDRNATSDFTLSVLWDVRETLGEEVSDQVVYLARNYLRTGSSTISDGLLRSLLRACDIACTSPTRDKLKLYETFSFKGF
jgi:hypothetical protein